MSAPKVLGILWLAITVPVVGTGLVLYNNLKPAPPVVVTKTVVVAPTASPSATLAPKISTPAKAVNSVKGGIK